jgi:hypothetical protein
MKIQSFLPVALAPLSAVADEPLFAAGIQKFDADH